MKLKIVDGESNAIISIFDKDVKDLAMETVPIMDSLVPYWLFVFVI
jgi:hypothetical protein